MAQEQELNISSEQMGRLKNELITVFPPQILPMLIEAQEIEARFLVGGKDSDQRDMEPIGCLSVLGFPGCSLLCREGSSKWKAKVVKFYFRWALYH